MTLTVYSIVLNHHQAPVWDKMYRRLGDGFTFVELGNLGADGAKGGVDFSDRPYLLRAWESKDNYRKAMLLAKKSDVAIFSTIGSLPFIKARHKRSKSQAGNASSPIKISFDMSERWLKQGLKNAMSPTIRRYLSTYFIDRWHKKPIYKLCMSGFAAYDHRRLHTFKDRCYKWGYFPFTGIIDTVKNKCNTPRISEYHNHDNQIRMVWCARMIDWKHPEMPIYAISELRKFHPEISLDIYGSGIMEPQIKRLTSDLGLTDIVTFHGNTTHDEVLKAMADADIFLFTSDRNEGWGAVANEAMAAGCAVVASDAIGSTPFLIRHRGTGCRFKSCNLNALVSEVKWLIDNPDERRRIAENGRRLIDSTWSTANAADSLLSLIDIICEEKAKGTSDKQIQEKIKSAIPDGPGSKA